MSVQWVPVTCAESNRAREACSVQPQRATVLDGGVIRREYDVSGSPRLIDYIDSNVLRRDPGCWHVVAEEEVARWA